MLLDNEKKIILAFRFVVALVALAFFLKQPPEARRFIPWQFYFVMGIFVLSNFVFFFEGAAAFTRHRAQMYLFAFDVGMVTILMIFLGLTNKEFYLVFFLTIFISALSKKTSHAFVISGVMAGLYVVFAVHGKTDIDLTSASFLVRVVLFFVVSSFVGHISETAEAARADVSRLTEWKERAEKLAMEQDKMAAVGLLAGGIAHEFNNLLAGIKGYADLAKMDAVDAREFAEVTIQQCNQAASLVRDLLSFSRKRGAETGLVDPAAAVEEVLRLVRKELAARGVEVERRIDKVSSVSAPAGAVERTALNLVTNAIAAMEPQGEKRTAPARLTVSLSERDGTVELRVSDTGCGMDEATLARVFEPFFSTRSGERCGVARATGLGLSVSKTLIEQVGGTIGVESELGGGTTVTVRLPASREERARAPAGKATGEAAEATGEPVRRSTVLAG